MFVSLRFGKVFYIFTRQKANKCHVDMMEQFIMEISLCPRHNFGFPFSIKYLTNKNRIKILQKYLRNGSFKIIRLKTTGQEKIFVGIRNYYYSLTF